MCSLTGLDEHGQKVQQAAAKAGIDPQAHCDKLAPQFQQLWKRLNISNDAFIRTTDHQHKTVVQRILQELFDKKLIYQDSYTGWYCTFDEPDCKRPIEKLSEHNYFFKMGQYQDRLINHIKKNELFIRPESRRNEVLGFLQTQKLGDLSISRPKSRLSWGIELPFDKDYVTYVWFDALVNYLSALEYLRPTPSQERYWPASIHLIGKDILTTHAVYWSTMLMALNLPLPETIFAHGWWTVNGEKMSKSRGNVVDPNKMVDEFGTDAFRYFLLREVPFGQDGDFSIESMIGRINAELANDLGNLLSRSLTLVERFSDGKIPAKQATDHAIDSSLLPNTLEIADIAEKCLVKLEFSRALEMIFGLVQIANRYLDKTTPWALAKKSEDRPRLNSVLYSISETLRVLSLLLFPFIPKAAEEITMQLGLSLNFSEPLLANGIRVGDLQPGTTIKKGASLFPRIESKPQGAKPVSDVPATPQPTSVMPASTPIASSPAPQASAPAQITIDEFQKIHLKTAKVLSAERVPKSEKLIKLQVSIGTEQRQIVAGIGKKYEPEALVDKTIVIVANLKPAKLMGIESQGMVLAAGDSEVRGLVTILEEVDPGTKVK